MASASKITPRADYNRHSLRNPISAALLSPPERLAEIAEILALGLTRLKARQSTPLSPDAGASWLDCPGHQSGHANALTDDGGLE